MDKIIIATIILIGSISGLFAQKTELKGKVTDENNKALLGINLNIIGYKYGSATNAKGAN